MKNAVILLVLAIACGILNQRQKVSSRWHNKFEIGHTSQQALFTVQIQKFNGLLLVFGVIICQFNYRISVNRVIIIQNISFIQCTMVSLAQKAVVCCIQIICSSLGFVCLCVDFDIKQSRRTKWLKFCTFWNKYRFFWPI